MRSSPKRKRVVDPHRRERVVEGVLDTIATYGVEGLTHRRVAEASGVSLSATTYYFATLEDLLEVAMQTATERDLALVRERFEGAPVEALSELLVEYLQTALDSDPSGIVVLAELYVASLRRERLRELVDRWEAAWAEILEPLAGPAAEAVSAAIGGNLLRGVILRGRRDTADIVTAVRSLLEALPAAPRPIP